MRKFVKSVFLTIIIAVVFATVSNATPITNAIQSFVIDDQFVDSRSPDVTSPRNYPDGKYLWSGHRETGNVHAYTLLKFEVGEDWKWDTATLNVPFNRFIGNDGETSVWFNLNDSWRENDIKYENLFNVWDFTNPILLAREFVPIGINKVANTFSFDISSLSSFEDNDIVSLVIGSILPDETANGDYWRKIVNSDYSRGSSAAKLVGSNPVPEPATILLFGIGLIGLAGIGRKKTSKT
ncbi:PEP-CTERM sorting domain-containing protein [bacterium]|jgi:hypothetical protein|nr:PEP-CTERM sorting domain-containing protein [bacterium]MBT4251224.1 PEP-CTERM sorting domain-containing protein [bacterium]MBT4597984.1 PEP-CTERM sorting domain-containing protein [bacterium]MBT6753603.1 PEP-CTERM sorting domain-containing protein [bacterium]MBT7037718.1 PEP-CTERM sorting domain-containing protein [bacterium]